MKMTPVEEGSFPRGSLSGPTMVWLSLERWPLFWTCIDPNTSTGHFMKLTVRLLPWMSRGVRRSR
jgi:hypothetical protein